MPHLPALIVAILLPFARLFSASTWRHVQVLLGGTRLTGGANPIPVSWTSKRTRRRPPMATCRGCVTPRASA